MSNDEGMVFFIFEGLGIPMFELLRLNDSV